MPGGSLLRAAERIARPWKNGGGVTCEIAVCPPAAAIDDFLWRVSTAVVTEPGPFSHFAGVDRIIAVLAGTLELRVEGMAPHRLGPDSEPFRFPGDVPAIGTPLGDGPVHDLNLMVRRGRYAADMRRVEQSRLTLHRGTTALVLALGDVAVRHHCRSCSLGAMDALQSDDDGGELAIRGAAILMLLRDMASSDADAMLDRRER